MVFFVITSTMKDAKRALDRKHPGWRYEPYNLERYGNVVVLFPSKPEKEILPNIEGIYPIEEAENILRKIYKNEKTVKKYMDLINENKENVTKKIPLLKREPVPIKFLDLSNVEGLSKYIMRTNSLNKIYYDDYIITEFKNFYGIYDDYNHFYLSIYKNSGTEEIAESIKKYLEDSPLLGEDLSRFIEKFTRVKCEELPEKYTDEDVELCNTIKQKLIKAAEIAGLRKKKEPVVI